MSLVATLMLRESGITITSIKPSPTLYGDRTMNCLFFFVWTGYMR